MRGVLGPRATSDENGTEIMTTRNRRLREALSQGLVMAPGCVDPFSARIIERIGFPAIYLGGLATGSQLGVMEPLLTASEQVEHARRVASAVDTPVIVDGGAGYGGPLATARIVAELEVAGISGVHLEDLVYPKALGYHRIPADRNELVGIPEMRSKLAAALDTRVDPDFLIIARTDSANTEGGIAAAIERGNAYGEVGADMILAFPDNMADVRRFATEVKYPTVLVYAEGGVRPSPQADELRELGYGMVIYGSSVLFNIYHTTHELLARLHETGGTGLNPQQMLAARKGAEEAMGLPRLLAQEQRLSAAAAS